MAIAATDRLAQMGYQQARRLLLATGLVVIAVVVAVMWARSVDEVEVVATILFVPIFISFVYKGVVGGVVAAVAATVVYTAMRYPAIDAVGVEQFTGLIASRAASYLIFGVVGGWAMHVLESSLTKLELYDEVDDVTGLYNARHLLHQMDLEAARARRYQTLFSVVVLALPSAPLHDLKGRERRSVLRDLGRLLGEGVRNVDHAVHATDGLTHYLAVVLPETAQQGADIFRGRFDDKVRGYFAERGVAFDGTEPARAITVPGDEDALAMLHAEFERIDALQHATPEEIAHRA